MLTSFQAVCSKSAAYLLEAGGFSGGVQRDIYAGSSASVQTQYRAGSNLCGLRGNALHARAIGCLEVTFGGAYICILGIAKGNREGCEEYDSIPVQNGEAT